MIFGDTGWRDITSIDPNVVITSGKIYVRFLNGMITIRLDAVVTTAKEIKLSLGSGWSMATNAYPAMILGNNLNRYVTLAWDGNHTIRSTETATSLTYTGHVTFMARNTYPSSLPGIPG